MEEAYGGIMLRAFKHSLDQFKKFCVQSNLFLSLSFPWQNKRLHSLVLLPLIPLSLPLNECLSNLYRSLILLLSQSFSNFERRAFYAYFYLRNSPSPPTLDPFMMRRFSYFLFFHKFFFLSFFHFVEHTSCMHHTQ